LRALASEYGVDDYKFGKMEQPAFEIKTDSPIVRDLNKCIGCFRCVRTCSDFQDVGAIGVYGRGNEIRIATFQEWDLLESLCVACGQCATRCPTGALTERDDTDDIWKAIEDPTKHVVIQTAPAPRAAIGELFGLEPGNSVTKQLNEALHKVGFDKVFDTNFTADLTIMEEGTELLLRLKKALVDKQPVALPQLTSCSPGWIKFMEHTAPDLLDYLSTCKSPQQMFGAVIKTYYAEKNGIDPENIVSVSLMPCTAKKFEADRPEMNDSGHKDVDYALTTREVARMVKEMGVELPSLDGEDFDDPLGIGSGAGLIFGATGGVMEAAIRTAYEIVTGEELPFEKLRVEAVRGMEGVKTAALPITKTIPDWSFLQGATLKVMVAHGLKNARWVLEELKAGRLSDYHFVEIMCCPGGCLSGGGQPIPTSPEIRMARAKAIYAEDEALPLRKSHENPVVKKIYEEFLTEGPCGHKSHKLLHTKYTPRGSKLV
jgi:NADH-quinone oxidoreductase subunit G/[NiFe] hydrogenase diaphorase moiety small subunit